MPSTRSLLPLTLVSLAVAAPAQAGELKVEREQITAGDESGKFHWVATYAAAPGEANVVTLDRAGGTWTFSDTGATAPLAAPAPCTRVSDTTVTCPERPDEDTLGLTFPTVSLGDGDDRFTLFEDSFDYVERIDGGTGNDVLTAAGSQDRAFMEGGPGDDTVTGSNDATAQLAGDELGGGPGADSLLGGGGDDSLHGGEGSDTLQGGAGADSLAGDGSGDPAADELSGGDGEDDVSYGEVKGPVRVNLAENTVGGAAAGDEIVGVEGIVGGDGDDVLAGDSLSNALDGGLGDDEISGGAGDDLIDGSWGRDTLRGEAGDDEIIGDDGKDIQIGGTGRDVLDAADFTRFVRDALRCGRGLDIVLAPDARQQIPADCERIQVDLAGPIVARGIRVEDRAVVLSVRCPDQGGSCNRTFSARDSRGRLLARRKVNLRKGTHRLRLPLTELGRAVLVLQDPPATLVVRADEASWRAPVRR